MKRRRIYLGVLLCAGVLAAGIRTGTGQGYSDPVVVAPPTTATDLPGSRRTIELRLVNRETGRPQSYKWAMSVAPGGSVKIECHEWVQVSLYGRQLPGFPKNRFQRTIPVDANQEGFADPYDFIVRWHSP